MYKNKLDELLDQLREEIFLSPSVGDVDDMLPAFNAIVHNIENYRQVKYVVIETHTGKIIGGVSQVDHVPYLIDEYENRHDLEELAWYYFSVRLFEKEYEELVDDILSHPDEWALPIHGLTDYQEVRWFQRNARILNTIDPTEEQKES